MKYPVHALGEVAEISAGNPAPQNPDDFASDGFPFVRMQDVGKYGHTTNLTEVKDRLKPSVAKKLKTFSAGSILVPKSGASIKLNHRAILGMNACVVSHLAVISPNTEILNNRFAYYWLCTQDLSKVAHDAQMPSLKTSELAKVEIPLPPLPEQERIVRLLDEAEQVRKLRGQANERMEDFVPALFHEMFGDITELASLKWDFHKVGSFANVSYGLADKLSAETTSDEGTRIITISNVTLDGNFDLSVQKYSLAGEKDKVKARLQKYDLLFNWRNGSEQHVGKTALWEDNLPGEVLHVSFLLKLRPDLEKVDPYYLLVLFNRLRKTGFFVKQSRFQINTKFNASELSALTLPLPPLDLQREFARRVQEAREVQSVQRRSEARVEALYQSMLSRAFGGGL